MKECFPWGSSLKGVRILTKVAIYALVTLLALGVAFGASSLVKL